MEGALPGRAKSESAAAASCLPLPLPEEEHAFDHRSAFQHPSWIPTCSQQPIQNPIPSQNEPRLLMPTSDRPPSHLQVHLFLHWSFLLTTENLGFQAGIHRSLLVLVPSSSLFQRQNGVCYATHK